MKKLIASLVLLGSVAVYAQSSSPDNLSGEQGAPASVSLISGVKPVFLGLVTRIHSLGIESRVEEMKINGITEMKRVVAFNASGAIVYDHEISMDGDGEYGFFDKESKAGRNAGLQVIPYSISLTSDNRIFLSTSAVGFKNMNSEMVDNHMNFLSNAWSVIDNLEILKFEYSQNFNFQNMNDFHFRVFQIDTKVNLVPELKENQYLALKTGAAPVGTHLTTVSVLTNDPLTLRGFETSLRYGLEYNLNTKKGWRINAEGMVGNQWSWQKLGGLVDPAKQQAYEVNMGLYNNNMNDYNIAQDNYNVELNQWQQDKLEYEQEFLNGTIVSEESYIALSGNNKPTLSTAKPTEPTKPEAESIHRSYMYLNPKIEFSKKINAENRSPMRLGVRFSANIPVGDKIIGAGRNIDLKKTNNPTTFNAGIFFNF